MMSKTSYSIRICKQAYKGLKKLPSTRQQQARNFINTHLRSTPKRFIPGKTKVTVHPPRSIAPCGRAQGPMLHFLVRGGERLQTKRLSGSLKGIYQYDLSRGDRIWWRVHEAQRIVEVLYIGPHPKVTE